MGKRIINLGGGSYHANIQGDYIAGNKKDSNSQNSKNAQPTVDVEVVSSETINTNGANYIEKINGRIIEGDAS